MYKVVGRVRTGKEKKTLEKGFTPNLTEELFTINKVKDTGSVTYTIAGTKGKDVQGAFYEPELQKTKQEIYRMEKLLKKNTRSNGVKEIYVKWKGYSNNFNTWIPVTDLE